jgi:nucleoside-diphosphate kinase
MKVLIICKPDCLDNCLDDETRTKHLEGVHRDLSGEVFRILGGNGWKTVQSKKVEKLSNEMLDKHYNGIGTLTARLTEAKGADFAKKVVDSTFKYMQRGPVIVAIIEKECEDEVASLDHLRSNIIGKTRPWEANPGTIRELFGCKDATHEPIENVVHCSGSVEEAAAEVELWSQIF